MHGKERLQQLTVVALVGKEGVDQAAVLCSLLGDRSDPRNEHHVLRVVTSSEIERSSFVTDDIGSARKWRCHERKSSWPTTWWKTHVGAPDVVLPMKELEQAISGRGTRDDGAVADIFLLCCGFEERLFLLCQLARALYRLDEQAGLLSSRSPPLLLGFLGSASASDWAARVIFSRERPINFADWKRPVAFFGFETCPYVSHVVKPGLVLMISTGESSLVALSPSLPLARRHATRVLERVLQCRVRYHIMERIGEETSEDLSDDAAVSITDLADPHAALSFLSLTMHDPHVIVLPCILFTLLKDSKSDITLTSSVCFDEAINDPSFGQLVLAIVQEWHVLLGVLDDVLSPLGYQAFSNSNMGGMFSSLLGNFLCNLTENTAGEVVQRSRRSDADSGAPPSPSHYVKRRANGLIHYRRVMERLVGHRVRNDPRLSTLLEAPDNSMEDTEVDCSARFFFSGVPHGMCISLGLGEVMGLDLASSMPETLHVVRKLQIWFQKEYVLPAGRVRIVGDAQHVNETSAPQAYGVCAVHQFKRFLQLNPLGTVNYLAGTNFVNSPIATKATQSRL